ncbi:MAG: GDP-mannose 4,6-dehydratase, partial [Proteobacteria bacterium]|nr:GDP-mannose 4,6-dehydratase [Pseudomonadota bacterium]
MKKALICGATGQDGAYLSKFLLDKGYEVFGTSRDSQMSTFQNLKALGIHDSIKMESMSLNDFRSVLQVLMKTEPDEIYNLAGQSSVGLSFQQPVETLESISVGALNLLEAIRFTGKSIRLYNAGSSECFGNTRGVPADEETPFRPRSPYAVAKSAAFWETANYREAYDIYACSGILFNHDSPLRPERFVTKKIISSICRIAAGQNEKLSLGNISIIRDWGWAPEYIEAMWLMLQQDDPEDFVIATGKTNSLEDFVSMAFSSLGLRWQDHVEHSQQFYRPSDLQISNADPTLALEKLSWAATIELESI